MSAGGNCGWDPVGPDGIYAEDAPMVLKEQQLLIVELAGGTAVRMGSELGGELGRLRTVRNAPDGSLWLVVDAAPGALVRVVPRA